MNSHDHTSSRTVLILSALLSLMTLVAPPVLAGETIVTAEVAKLTASIPVQFGDFGECVSVDGDRIAVGARDSASAYVFERTTDGAWVQVAEIIPLDGEDFFGVALSLDGDRLAVGASRSVYVFERDPEGNWFEVTKLTGPFSANLSGWVSLDGDRIAAGAIWDDENGFESGAAYVFEHDGAGEWIQTARLSPSDGAERDRFGKAISLDGERILVGSYRDDDNGSNSGSAYVFDRDVNGTWSLVDKFLPFDGAARDEFGYSVSLDGDRITVGAPRDEDFGDGSGSVHIFERETDGTWSQVTKLLPLDGDRDTQFGSSVSIDGDRVLIGALLDDDNGPDSGSAYVVERDVAGNWREIDKLLPLDGDRTEKFGNAVSLDADRFAVGAKDDNTNVDLAGSAYIFEPVLVSPTLSITGTCPGEVAITSSGTTPRSRIRLYHSASQGSFMFGGGPCGDTEFGIEAPELHRDGSTGFMPDFTRVRSASEFWCGRYMQMLDEKTCLVSEVAQMPVSQRTTPD